MKKIFYNNSILFIAFFTVFSITSFANDGEKKLPVELKYTCHINNNPLYKLIVAGDAQPDEYTIIIRDTKKNILFRENIKGETFTKSFLINTVEMGDNTLHFEIVSKKSNQSVTYEINRYSHLEEEMAVIEPR